MYIKIKFKLRVYYRRRNRPSSTWIWSWLVICPWWRTHYWHCSVSQICLSGFYRSSVINKVNIWFFMSFHFVRLQRSIRHSFEAAASQILLGIGLHLTTCLRRCRASNFPHWFSGNSYIIIIFYSFPVALQPSAGHGLPMLEVSRSQTTTHHSR
jgi:hypothetical protein